MSITALATCRIDPGALRRRLAALPTTPGIYIYRNEAAEILYVGKAVNLRNRVRSYFHRDGQAVKVRQMVAQIADWEVIVTGTELEALVLECTLIKKHRPKYNVRLRDDKQYPYIKVSLNEEWPRVYITRRIAKDGARYFGPFTDSRSVWRTLDLLNKLFPYRTCHIAITGTDARPCLQFHIHRCLGPCIGAVSRDDYQAVMAQVVLFLDGKHEEVIADLTMKMTVAAESLQFERAAFVRDQIRSVEKVTARQRIVEAAMKDQDVVAFARSNGDACVEVFFIRGGKLIGREDFLLEGTKDEDVRQIMTSFVTQFYDSAAYIPPEIVLQSAVDEARIVESWLRQKRGGQKVTLTVPRRGKTRRLVDLVAANAAEVLAQMRARWLADERKTAGALIDLAEHLDLEEPPRRIECYDISNVQGSSSVGSMVVFENGQPANREYRRFQIKTVEGANDFASIQEIVRRRFSRAQAVGLVGSAAEANERKGWTNRPDLVIIDGGRGQLNAALAALQELNMERIPIVSLAKQSEEIFTPTESRPIILPRESQALYLVQRIRDEAHRFALTYHRKLRARRGTRSALDDVPGIGPKRRAALLRRFGSVRAIREATIEDLVATPGMDSRVAASIKERLQASATLA
ncbi:MAG: excinuclease ABC subunit UvrC [Chloroflexota bacterium]|nr:MAG: excinuclease ABC subunit UvrC [Chloroflexota bacterium]